ncbi:MAG: aminodeoxychorismate lyase [Gammaproteobacteria bacterium]|nr:aminodeoxychorismate lyase [Gammaproteobacteria bacterium]
MWLIDGRRSEHVAVEDRGLQYGDGLFETMAVLDGRIRHLPLHLARLAEGCQRLGLPRRVLTPLRDELAALAASQHNAAVIKLIITRGEGPRGYAPPARPQPRRMLGVFAWPSWPASHYTRGVAVRVCDTRLGSNPQLAGIKHLNRLEQVLARREWSGKRWQEGLMMNTHNHVVCGTMSNVFAVKASRLLTPSLATCGVAGVMRAAVRRQAAALGLSCEECELGLDALAAADELFLTNALIGIWPVRRLGDHQRAVGPVTRQLQQAMGLAGARS